MKYNRLSTYVIKKIITCFSEDLTASKTAKLLNINRNTINRYFNEFRDKIFTFLREKNQAKSTKKENGTFEVDESYFGARRVKGKRGRGASGKIPVFGLLKRDGDVYVEVVEDCKKATLMPIIKGKILEGSVVNSDGWKAYNGLIVNGYRHYRVHHSKNEFARGKRHVNGIESFWSQAKRRLAKFNGVEDGKFLLHLKECEFRWNYRGQDLNKIIFDIFKRY